jgi:hypothetical protein
MIIPKANEIQPSAGADLNEARCSHTPEGSFHTFKESPFTDDGELSEEAQIRAAIAAETAKIEAERDRQLAEKGIVLPKSGKRALKTREPKKVASINNSANCVEKTQGHSKLEVPANKIDLEEARHFLRQLDPSTNIFCFQTLNDWKPKGQKFDPLAEHRTGTLADLTGWLIAKNRQGCGIFVTVNETDGKGRKMENIKRVRAVFRELDLPQEQARPVCLEPSIVVESSPGKFHEYFLCDPASPLTHDDFNGVQNFLVDVGDSDPNARGLPRVLRLPGFFHCKGEPVRVRLREGSGKAQGGATPAMRSWRHCPLRSIHQKPAARQLRVI